MSRGSVMKVFHESAGGAGASGRSSSVWFVLCLVASLMALVFGTPRLAFASGPLLRWTEGTCSRPLYFGITPDWPPYQYIDLGGVPLGGTCP